MAHHFIGTNLGLRQKKRPPQKGKDLTLIPTALLQLIRRTHCDSKSVEKGTILIGCSN